jgi:hypothetical protein
MEQTEMFVDELTPKQRNAVVALLTANTITEARKIVGVGHATMHRWRQNPLFIKAVEDERKRMMESLRDRFVVAAGEAVEALRLILKDADKEVVVKAAATLLKPFSNGPSQIVAVNQQVENAYHAINRIPADDEIEAEIARRKAAGDGIDYGSIGLG